MGVKHQANGTKWLPLGIVLLCAVMLVMLWPQQRGGGRAALVQKLQTAAPRRAASAAAGLTTAAAPVVSPQRRGWAREIANHSRKVYSQRGQDGVLEWIFQNVGTTNKFFVEVGACARGKCRTWGGRKDAARPQAGGARPGLGEGEGSARRLARAPAPCRRAPGRARAAAARKTPLASRHPFAQFGYNSKHLYGGSGPNTALLRRKCVAAAVCL